jgi:hypothetical protein
MLSPKLHLLFRRTFLTVSRHLWLLILLIFVACQNAGKEPLPFYASPHLGQNVKEARAGTDSLLISNGIFNPGITRYPWWIKTTLSNPGLETELFFSCFQ